MLYTIESETIEDIADAIRNRSGLVGALRVQDFDEAILRIQNGENTSAAAASAAAARASEISAASSALTASECAANVLSTAGIEEFTDTEIQDIFDAVFTEVIR